MFRSFRDTRVLCSNTCCIFTLRHLVIAAVANLKKPLYSLLPSFHHVTRSGAFLCYSPLCICSSPSFLNPLAVFPFTPRSFRLCFPFLWLSSCFFPAYLILVDSRISNFIVFLMSHRQYPAPPPHRTNPFVTAEPIYETGPLITQPRRDLSSPYSPCVYLISFLPNQSWLDLYS